MRRAAEAHVILQHGGWRDTMDLERAPKKHKHAKRTTAFARQDEGTSNCRGTVQLTGIERSGRTKVVRGTRPANSKGYGRKGQGYQVQAHLLLQVRRMLLGTDIGLLQSLPVGARRAQRSAAQPSIRHVPTAFFHSGPSATFDAPSSKRPPK